MSYSQIILKDKITKIIMLNFAAIKVSFWMKNMNFRKKEAFFINITRILAYYSVLIDLITNLKIHI